MSIQASGTQVPLGLVHDAAPLNDPPSISPPVSLSRASDEHSEAWPLSCYYTMWCLLQLTLVKPGKACHPCHHCPFLRVPTLPRVRLLWLTPLKWLTAIVSKENEVWQTSWSIHRLGENEGKKGIKFLRERICVFVLLFLSELASLHKPHNFHGITGK